MRRIINAVAPIRVADLGGWTDTWFAERGVVCNIAVYPYAEVQISVTEDHDGSEPRIAVHAENFGERYIILPGVFEYDRHPLIDACIDIMELPTSMSFDVNLYSSVPAGCSTGTSAAVSVALIGALDLLTPGRLTSYEVAALAQRVETDKLGLQCGIQDQIASAYGGICHIEMFDYPHASVSRVELPNSLWWELERRLVLVFLGQAHSSSEVHGKVIEQLEAHGNPGVLARLRDAARAGKNALAQGDFKAYGEALIRNTQAQQELHEALVSEAAREVINLARAYGALGWKINGAGGEGGSLTLLFGPEGASKRAFINHLPTLNPAYEVIPTYLSRVGLRRWESA